MKNSINPGAYGWRHQHWLKSFYPEELPVNGAEDWRLSYYSNEFNTVMVPFNYWQSGNAVDCEGWLNDVNDDFQFFVECHESMLEQLSAVELADYLKILQPQLSGLVFLQANRSAKEKFTSVIDVLGVEVLESVPAFDSAGKKIAQSDNPFLSSLVIIENDLSDLRAARTVVENIVVQYPDVHSTEITIIFDHPKLKAENLSKFRSVLEIMGY
jgi:Protein of unknown function DUF72